MERSPQKILRRPAVEQLVGLRRTQLDVLVSKGEFPAPFKISEGGRAIGWWESDVLAWQDRVRARREAPTS